jgi:hypothetical protein
MDSSKDRHYSKDREYSKDRDNCIVILLSLFCTEMCKGRNTEYIK